MDTKKGLTILIEAAMKANKTGAFSIEESAIIYEAIKFFTSDGSGTKSDTGGESKKEGVSRKVPTEAKAGGTK